MITHRISGVDVCFPHEPYGVQKVFMNQVVRAIDHEENALLEAPTGCGKTLSLLCGALAWQTAAKAKKAAAEQAATDRAAACAKQEGVQQDTIEDSTQEQTPSHTPHKAAADENSPGVTADEPVVVPKIYYATRTHSQIAQVRNVCGMLMVIQSLKQSRRVTHDWGGYWAGAVVVSSTKSSSRPPCLVCYTHLMLGC